MLDYFKFDGIASHFELVELLRHQVKNFSEETASQHNVEVTHKKIQLIGNVDFLINEV